MVTDGAAWQAIVDAFPTAGILQTALWGDFKARWGWRVPRLVWDEPGAAAQVLTRPLPGGRLSLAYVPHGPLLAPDASADDWRRVLAGLGEWARQERVGILKVELAEAEDRSDIADVLRALGWQASHEAIQFRNTMTSDLTGGLEAVWQSLKPKTRYNVGLAERRGVTTRRAGAEGLAAFLALYEETGLRDGFATREPAYYLDVWSAFLAAGKAEVLLAERDGQALAGAIPVVQGGTATYMYGASATEGRRDMPAFAVMWETLRWATESGCDVFDWWGGPTVLDESDPLWGVYRFKLGFGATLVRRLGAWDLPVRQVPFAAYRALAGWRRRLGRSVARARTLY